MYNKRIRDEVGPRLKDMGYQDSYDWMMSKTDEVSYSFKLTASTVHRTSILLLTCSVFVQVLLH